MRFRSFKIVASIASLGIVAFVGVARAEQAPAVANAEVASPSDTTRPSASPVPIEPVSNASANPTTQTGQSDGDETETTLDPASLLPDLPPIPTKRTSMVGGTVVKLDRIKDQMTLEIFGGGKTKISFDPRTELYLDGTTAPAADLELGSHVYVDTVLNRGTVFARRIRIKTASIGECQGIVISYDGGRRELTVRDPLSPKPIKVQIAAATGIVNGQSSETARSEEILPGSLVELKFATRIDKQIVASEISILATPESEVTLTGRVTGLDLSSNTLTLVSSSNGKTYEIRLDPLTVTADDKLREAVDVTVLARFHDNSYVAHRVSVDE